MNNEEIEKLEKELAGLKPRGLSAERKTALFSEISQDQAAGKIIPFPSIIALTAAAAALVLAILFAMNNREAGAKTNGHELAQKPEPVREETISAPLPNAPGIDTILVANEDEGIMYLDENTPVRRSRYHVLDRAQWTDPRSGKKHELIRPRNGVVLTSLRVD